MITAARHGLADDDLVYVSGVEGNTAANGLWSVTVQDNDHFRLRMVDSTSPSDGSGSARCG